MWHISDSQDQILPLAFRFRSLEPCKLFPLRLEVGGRVLLGGVSVFVLRTGVQGLGLMTLLTM